MKGALPDDIVSEVVGRRRELRLLLDAVEQGKAVLLLGLPGVSKTTIVRAVARFLAGGDGRVFDVTGDEQLTAHALVGGFDPPLVISDGYKPEYFIEGPLAGAMLAGRVLYVEELNRAPSGALNALMTALSERYLEVPRLGRIEAKPGFTVIGAANPLDDVGTGRLSRGLADRFLTLELGYQSRDEELEIVRRRCGSRSAGLHAFAVDVARESRRREDLRHGASVRGAIDFADLLGGWGEEPDLETLRFVGCTAYAGKLRVKPTANRTACEIVHEIIDALLARDYGGSVDALLERARETGADALFAPEEGEGGSTPTDQSDAAGGGDRAPERRPDEIPGLSRSGSGSEPGESRSVPMVERDRPGRGGARPDELTEQRETHLRDLDAVLREARDLVVRVRDGAAAPVGARGGALRSAPLVDANQWPLDVERAVEAFVANGGYPAREDLQVLERAPRRRNYVIVVDHSGSMVGRKLELAATMAAILAQLSTAGQADYAVIAFDDELKEVKALDDVHDVEDVVDRILRLPEGRATDLGKAFSAAAEASETLPEATDVILISDCMPTKGVKTFAGLARLAERIPSLYICFTDDRQAAIRMYHGERQLDLYEWWAQRWVGDGRFKPLGAFEEVDDVVDLLSDAPNDEGPSRA